MLILRWNGQGKVDAIMPDRLEAEVVQRGSERVFDRPADDTVHLGAFRDVRKAVEAAECFERRLAGRRRLLSFQAREGQQAAELRGEYPAHQSEAPHADRDHGPRPNAQQIEHLEVVAERAGLPGDLDHAARLDRGHRFDLRPQTRRPALEVVDGQDDPALPISIRLIDRPPADSLRQPRSPLEGRQLEIEIPRRMLVEDEPLQKLESRGLFTLVAPSLPRRTARHDAGAGAFPHQTRRRCRRAGLGGQRIDPPLDHLRTARRRAAAALDGGADAIGPVDEEGDGEQGHLPP